MAEPNDAGMAVRVASLRREAEHIVSLDLVREDGAALPAFGAGAHVDVHLPGGLVRPYSLCNPHDGGGVYRIAVRLELQGRGGSRAVHALRCGDVLRIGAPRNHFTLNARAPHVLLLAAGIGITPIVAMAHALHAQGRAFALHYAVSAPGQAAFLDLLRDAPFAGSVQVHDASRGARADLCALLAAQPPGAEAWACGPARFLAGAAEAAARAGWSPERLHVEHFGAPLAMRDAVEDTGDVFEVQAGEGGPVVRIRRSQPITVALQAAGIHIPVSCEQGVCGTCITRVLQGEPEHLDHHLSPQERAQGYMLPCCSRSRSSRLVLDLAG